MCTHIVRSGESVSRIAARYRVTRAGPDPGQPARAAGSPPGRPAARPCRGATAASPQTTAGETPGTEPDAEGILLTRVGPRRIPTSPVRRHPRVRRRGHRLGLAGGGPMVSDLWPAALAGGTPASTSRRRWARRSTPRRPGTVVFSGWSASYGQRGQDPAQQRIRHRLRPQPENLVEVGDDVEAGQLIATVGRSGHATGPPPPLRDAARRHGLQSALPARAVATRARSSMTTSHRPARSTTLTSEGFAWLEMADELEDGDEPLEALRRQGPGRARRDARCARGRQPERAS